jgi:hypothetical protein
MLRGFFPSSPFVIKKKKRTFASMRIKLLLYSTIASILLPMMARAQVVINEIQVANVDMYIDPSFNYGSWVELYNTSNNLISLNGMKLRHTSSDGVMNEQVLTAQHSITTCQDRQ